jgi:hypothetical protein
MQAIRFCLLLILTATTANCFSQTFPTRKINFDGDWKFAFGDANNPAKEFK